MNRMRLAMAVFAVSSMVLASCVSNGHVLPDLAALKIDGLTAISANSSAWEFDLRFTNGKGIYCLKRIDDSECIEIRSGISEADFTDGELRVARWSVFSEDGKIALITEDIGESSPYFVYILVENLDSSTPNFRYVKLPPRPFDKYPSGFEYPVPVKISANQRFTALYPVDQKVIAGNIRDLISISFDQIEGKMTSFTE